MEKATPQEDKKITEFAAIAFPEDAKDKWPPAYCSLSEEDRRIVLHKFLLARKWDIGEANKMLLGTVAHRKEYGLDELPNFPAAIPVRGYDTDALVALEGRGPREHGALDTIYKATSTCYNCAIHKWDKQGRPVFYEQVGRTNAKHLVDVYKQLARPGTAYTDNALLLHLHCNAAMAALIRHNDAVHRNDATGHRVLHVSVVFELDGLGWNHLYKPALEIFKVIQQCDQQHYPEGLHRIYATNCPSMVRFAYNIVKGWLDPRVRDKIEFLSPDKTKSRLLEVIDAECLPEYLGGKCRCEGGCTPFPSGKRPQFDGETVTEGVAVGGGQTMHRDLKLKAGETATWEFGLASHNIIFHASFNGECVEEAGAKVDGGNGSHTAAHDGTLRLVFDNSYSWFTGKTVNLRLFKME